jgi:hypothetical protein
MRFGAASFARLVCALRQNNSPFKAWPDEWPILLLRSQTRSMQCAGRKVLAAEAAGFELLSVFEARV